MHLQYLGGSTVISDIVIGGGTMPVLRKRTNPFWGRPAEEKHALNAHLRQGNGGGGGVDNTRMITQLQQDVTSIIELVTNQLIPTMTAIKDAPLNMGDVKMHAAPMDLNDTDVKMGIVIDNEPIVKVYPNIVQQIQESASKRQTAATGEAKAVTGAINQLGARLKLQIEQLARPGPGQGDNQNTDTLLLIHNDIKDIKKSLGDEKTSPAATLKRLGEIDTLITKSFTNLEFKRIASDGTRATRLDEIGVAVTEGFTKQDGQHEQRDSKTATWRIQQAEATKTRQSSRVTRNKDARDKMDTLIAALAAHKPKEVADFKADSAVVAKLETIVNNLSTKLTKQLADSTILQKAMTTVTAQVDAFATKITEAKTQEERLALVEFKAKGDNGAGPCGAQCLRETAARGLQWPY